MTFPKFDQIHDPDGQADWSFPFILNTGETIVTPEVKIVDPTSTTEDTGSSLVVMLVACGQVSPSPNLWSVTAWVNGGEAGEEYYLRCSIITNSTPPRKFHKTMRIVCAQT